jgi:hypothetical protein
MLIDDRIPPFSEPDRPVWEPNWRVWSWVLAAVAAGAGAYVTAGLIAYLLICAMVVCAAQACARAMPDLDGLREHRQ